MIVECEYCHKEFDCAPSRFYKSKHHCCSKPCMNTLLKEIRESDPAYMNCTCEICGKKFHLKEYRKNRYKIHCCSKECLRELEKIRMSGENNHQYGLKGSINASWKSDVKITNYGYRKIRCLDHPFKDCDGFVFEHRLIAEMYLLNDENSIEIDGNRYLKKEYEVHHIDENRLNNDVDNLMVVTHREHQMLHKFYLKRQRNQNGQFMPKAV